MARRQHFLGRMSNRGTLLVVASSLLCATAAAADPAKVTVYLERHGRTVDHDGDQVEIPAFGGGDRAWSTVATCVKQQFSPFQIEVVETEPRGEHITAVIGGRASLLDLDDRTTNGVGPYIPGRVQPNATVHVFSLVGTGERDTQNLCAVTVHEVSHALGLDHTFKCGDTMSYFLDRCGPRKLMDVDAPCGETSARLCGTGEKTQNSYRMLAALVGLRGQPQPEPEPQPQPKPPVTDPWTDGSDDGTDATDDNATDDGSTDDGSTNGDADDGSSDDSDDGATTQYYRDRRGNLYTAERVQGRDGYTYVILRRVEQSHAPTTQPAKAKAPATQPTTAKAPIKHGRTRGVRQPRWMR